MKMTFITCDVCHKTKGEANRWLIGWEVRHGYAIADWDDDFVQERRDDLHHLCSESCAFKMQSEYIRRTVIQNAESCA